MFFSVVIPLYNQAGTVARTIQSILEQTVQDYEIIVVNDGSVDSGPSIVEAFDDPRIRLIHQENGGVSVARNRGIEESASDLIAFLDADDEWLPKYLENIKRLATLFPQCDVYATRYFYHEPGGRKYVAKIRGIPQDFEGVLHDYFGIAVCSNPPAWTGTVCVRKAALNWIGGFPPCVASGEDLLTWARLAAYFMIAYSMEPLAIYHLDDAATYRDRPSRVPEENDVVGRELECLFRETSSPAKNALGRYCSHWHKMRCSCYLRLGMQHRARREIEAARRYGLDSSLFAYSCVSFLPEAIIRKIFRYVMSFR